MREHIAEVIVGALVLALAGFFLVYSVGVGNVRSASGYPLTATFSAVNGLAVGADVRVSGVKVGSVADIRLNPNTYQADVTVRIRDGVEIPSDSLPALKSEGLLGGLYFAIEPGAEAEMLPPGGQFDYPGQGSIDVVRLLADFVAQGGQ